MGWLPKAIRVALGDRWLSVARTCQDALKIAAPWTRTDRMQTPWTRSAVHSADPYTKRILLALQKTDNVLGTHAIEYITAALPCHSATGWSTFEAHLETVDNSMSQNVKSASHYYFRNFWSASRATVPETVCDFCPLQVMCDVQSLFDSGDGELQADADDLLQRLGWTTVMDD